MQLSVDRWNKCETVCEIQAKVSESKSEIMSIKVWFQAQFHNDFNLLRGLLKILR